ncbi:hypothetical protein LTV02_11755 [Nocardia yamanashiensis]|uniref:hypothetical protein n=1 Tax=Nocardia yamanashiensis TaxID=209247 RepID=UPI001E4B019F|nr:hypothetical protein [Nocardia yamanashiensis]UGT44010.1 hypothetical protein LTV02_11755 [Nocardia yamanashiensis]
MADTATHRIRTVTIQAGIAALAAGAVAFAAAPIATAAAPNTPSNRSRAPTTDTATAMAATSITTRHDSAPHGSNGYQPSIPLPRTDSW